MLLWGMANLLIRFASSRCCGWFSATNMCLLLPRILRSSSITPNQMFPYSMHVHMSRWFNMSYQSQGYHEILRTSMIVEILTTILPWYQTFLIDHDPYPESIELKHKNSKPKLGPRGRGGNQMGKSNFSMIPKWIILSFQYTRTGEKEFLNLVTVLTLHIDRQIFENHYVRVKNQSCRRPIEWPIKTNAREALSQWKKNKPNQTYQLGQKSSMNNNNPPPSPGPWPSLFLLLLFLLPLLLHTNPSQCPPMAPLTLVNCPTWWFIDHLVGGCDPI